MSGETSGGGSAGPTTTGATSSTSTGETAEASTSATAASGSSDTTTSSTSTDASTSDGTSLSTTATGTGAETDTTTGDRGSCGDGVVDPGESCDDGNLEDGDGCEAECAWTPCSIVWSKLHTLEGRRLRGFGIAPIGGGDVAIAVDDNPSQLDNHLRLMRIDGEGEELWSTLVSDARTTPGSVAVAEDGVMVAVGTDYSGNDLAAGHGGDGGQQWALTDLFPKTSGAADVAPIGGDLVIAGRRSLVGTSWLMRIGSDGGTVWKKTVAPPDFATVQLETVAVAGDSIYAAGIAQPEGGVTGGWISRHTSDGELVWVKTVPKPEPQTSVNFFGIGVGPGGEVAVTGHVFTANLGEKPGSDFYVILYDADGELLWSALHDSGEGKTYDRGEGVVIDAFGNIIAAGRVDDDYYRGHIRKYEAGGALICEATISAIDDDHTIVHDITIADDGLPRITGAAGGSLFVAATAP